jgi:hypothetical protein
MLQVLWKGFTGAVRYSFDCDFVKDLKGYVIKLPKFAKYAQILKNSIASKETVNERIILMKGRSTIEEALA